MNTGQALARVAETIRGLEWLSAIFADAATGVSEQPVLLALVQAHLESGPASLDDLASRHTGGRIAIDALVRRLVQARLAMLCADRHGRPSAALALTERAARRITGTNDDAWTAGESLRFGAHRVARTGDSVVIRRRAPLAAIAHEPISIRRAFELWSARRGASNIPKLDFSDVYAVVDQVGFNRTHLVDTSSAGPYGYRYVLFSPAAHNIKMIVPTAYIGDLMDGAMRLSLGEDYHLARHAGEPSLHHVVARVAGQQLSYSRLILPFATAGHVADRLVICIDKHPFPKLSVQLT